MIVAVPHFIQMKRRQGHSPAQTTAVNAHREATVSDLPAARSSRCRPPGANHERLSQIAHAGACAPVAQLRLLPGVDEQATALAAGAARTDPAGIPGVPVVVSHGIPLAATLTGAQAVPGEARASGLRSAPGDPAVGGGGPRLPFITSLMMPASVLFRRRVELEGFWTDA